MIHVDRWWNPAVEDQATDRAFRIGQRKDVQVRKFVCVGTLEERIDAMIEEKKALAERIVGHRRELADRAVNVPTCARSCSAVAGGGVGVTERGTRRTGTMGRPRPLEVEGGIKARSKRGAIGEQWWSRRFIDVLESFGMTGRLARGRNYARRGQVIGFEISCGYVTAQVQGSRPKPYRVRIQVTAADHAAVAEGGAGARRAGAVPGQAAGGGDAARRSRRCSPTAAPRCSRAPPRDLEMSCSCPDWGVPCKHLAAVCYVLAEAFDLDPFGILAWRGRGREDLLGALRLTGRRGREPRGRSSTSPTARWPSAWRTSGHRA